MDTSDNPNSPDLQSLVAEIVSSYVRKNYVEPGDLSVVINTVYHSLLSVGKPPAPNPAVRISQSATRSYVVLSRLRLARKNPHPSYSRQARTERERLQGAVEPPVDPPLIRDGLFRKAFGLGEAARLGTIQNRRSGRCRGSSAAARAGAGWFAD